MMYILQPVMQMLERGFTFAHRCKCYIPCKYFAVLRFNSRRVENVRNTAYPVNAEKIGWFNKNQK